MHEVQGTLFPFLCAETIRALARQIIANENTLEAGATKDYHYRMACELSLAIRVQDQERVRQMTGGEFRERAVALEAIERLDRLRAPMSVPLRPWPQRWQSRKRPISYQQIAPSLHPSCVT